MHLVTAPRQPADRGQTRPDCPATWHGTVSAYRGGCRCPEAVEHKRIYDKRLKQGRHQPTIVDATGTRRRLQALAALGWGWRTLALHFGCTHHAVSEWAKGQQVHVDTRRRVRAVYEALAGTPGPSAESRRRAARKGWAPPQAWDDDDAIDDPAALPDLGADNDPQPDPVAVDRALAGHLRWRHLTRPDRVEVARRAHQADNKSALATALGVSARTLLDWAQRDITQEAA